MEYLVTPIVDEAEIQAKLNEFAPLGFEYIDFIYSELVGVFGYLVLGRKARGIG